MSGLTKWCACLAAASFLASAVVASAVVARQSGMVAGRAECALAQGNDDFFRSPRLPETGNRRF